MVLPVSGAIVIFFISYKTPKWIGVYWSNKHDYGEPVGASTKHLRFNVQWSIGRHFGQVYCVTLLFFCGARPIKIPLSALIGMFAGFIFTYFIYLGRTKFEKQKTKVAIFMASLISIGSAIAFSSGSWYIKLVWGREDREDSAAVGVGAFLIFLAFAAIVHFIMYRNTLRKEAAAAEMPPDQRLARKYKTNYFKPSQMNKLRNRIRKLSNMDEVPEDVNVNQASGNHVDDAMPEDVNVNKASGNDVDGVIPEDEHVNKASGNDVDDMMPSSELKDDGDGVPTVINTSTEGAVSADALSVDDDAVAAFREKDENETWCSLAWMHCCGNAEKSGERPDKTTLEIIVSVVKWVVWILANSLFLFLVVVNIGATYQYRAVKKNLPKAFELLYPPDYVTGEVCAWDTAGPEANITTFDTVEEALTANFSIVHCGACGACSTWNDLSLQWTTRTYLADVAQDCAKKSLFGGEDAVFKCNNEDIGFTDDCAMCWTVDELCAKKNCVFIFLQGVMINKLTSFEVGPNEITSATCDEAMCGPEFVPCSGATRRRMNIVSTIARPIEQQCTIIDQDWATIFDHP
eukprot:scaffold1169_cov120-Cylindrotheca_fusiformis.AAC.15